MSSDGSVSSRISQFGLYRNIDARTEEFLKLSKKRQIKQGCVCAAISTALTVTVVVTVLLIYEYNVIAEAKKSSHKTNWLNLMNNSADDPNLLEILNKEKNYIDKTTLKLLPILLKALEQNRYMEKIREETTSPYTPYEMEITTETAISKNIFSDTRNWMKSPYSRLYTVEYKTSPIMYFKNPTRNVEYFTKIRKIRDYQRILNYVDKMISEKSALSTTQPMRKDYSHTGKPYKMTTSTQNHKPVQKVENKQNTIIHEKNTSCKCSHKLSEVMNKFFNSIHQVLVYFSTSNSKETIQCNKNSVIQTKPSKSLNEKPTMNNVYKVITENVFGAKSTRTPLYKKFLNRNKYIIDTPTKSFDIRRDNTVDAIMNLIKHSFNKRNKVAINFKSNEAFSTTNSYVKSSDTNDILKESSIAVYSKPLDNINAKPPFDTVTTVADYILQNRMYDVSSDTRSSLSTFSDTDFSDDYEYTETTEITTINANNINRLDPYNLELVKSNSIPVRQKKKKEDKSYPFKSVRISDKLFNGAMRKSEKLFSRAKENPVFLPNHHRFGSILEQIKLTTQSTLDYEINVTHTTKPKEKTTIIENRTKTKNIAAEDTNPNQIQTNTITSEKKIDKVWDDNISKESALKHIQETIMLLNNETTTHQFENYNRISADTYQWEKVKFEENDTSTKFMIPVGRSTYLEMRRNDWKHDENHDFDTDMNYIFE